MTRPFVLAVGLLALVAVSGCATGDAMTQPEMTLVALELTDVTLFETSADVTVRISNPDLAPLVIEGGVVRLSIDGIPAGRGMFEGPVEIPRLSSGTVDLTLYVSNVAVATRLRSFIESERFGYTLKSVLYRQTDLGTRRIRTSRQGFVDLNEARREGADAP